ncbi:MAG: acyltransferase [Maritimibacter sp.]|nr:acyltransferase [Maritimibacter sp.]
MSLKYRPEIDGLRAVAVLSVMIYHLKISLGGAALIPGGFLGVDLFFVLSGYLITLILLREKEKTGRISFGQFYLRRVRRILPALFLVILVSLPAAWILFLPSELARFAESIPAALFFYSNVFWFYVQGEYGAQSSLYQPLLHTWSLAIEEQFYLLFPLFVLIVPKRWFAPAAGVALVLTLGLAEATTQASPRISFFSPVSRAWELLAGSMLAVAQLRGWTLGQGRRWAALVPPCRAGRRDRLGQPDLARPSWAPGPRHEPRGRRDLRAHLVHAAGRGRVACVVDPGGRLDREAVLFALPLALSDLCLRADLGAWRPRSGRHGGVADPDLRPLGGGLLPRRKTLPVPSVGPADGRRSGGHVRRDPRVLRDRADRRRAGPADREARCALRRQRTGQ